MLQKATIRIINFANFQSPSSPLFARSKILKFPDIIEYFICSSTCSLGSLF